MRKTDFNPKWNFSQFCAKHALALMFLTQNISDTAIFIAENIMNIDATTKQHSNINQNILSIFPPRTP
jgi:hypothetical protein